MYFSRFVSHISSAQKPAALPQGWFKLASFPCSSSSWRAEVGWNKILHNPEQNDTPCKQLQAILSRFSNVEMFQQCTILIIRKIKLLPHVVVKANSHLHSPPTPGLCGQEECDCNVARGGGPDPQQSVLPILTAQRKAVPKKQ